MTRLVVPIVETERLILREPRAEDGAAFIAFVTSERARYVGGPMGPEQAWRAWATQIGHWVARGFGEWVVTRRGEDRFLGLVGCWRPEPWPENEIGWSVTAEAEGRGYAREAALAARAYAYAQYGWTTAVSYIDPANTRSLALAERLGCVRDAAADRPDPEDVVMRHPAPEALRR